MVVYDFNCDGVVVRMSTDGLICAVSFDVVRWRARLARIYAVLEQEYVWLLGKIEFARVHLPGTVEGVLRRRQLRHQQQSRECCEKRLFHRKTLHGFELRAKLYGNRRFLDLRARYGYPAQNVERSW